MAVQDPHLLEKTCEGPVEVHQAKLLINVRLLQPVILRVFEPPVFRVLVAVTSSILEDINGESLEPENF